MENLYREAEISFRFSSVNNPVVSSRTFILLRVGHVPLQNGVWKGQGEPEMRELRTPGWAKVQLLVLLPFLLPTCLGQRGPGAETQNGF